MGGMKKDKREKIFRFHTVLLTMVKKAFKIVHSNQI